MLYSPSTNGFYSRDVHGANIPADVVEITPAKYQSLLEGNRLGQAIVMQDGAPVVLSPPPPSLTALREEAKAKVLNWARSFGATFTAGYTPEEVAAWPTKAVAARDHLAGRAAPMILAEAAVTGETPSALAMSVLARAEAYTVIVAKITGLRRATIAAIDAAPDAAAVDEALQSALGKAQEMVAEITGATGN